MLDYITTKTTFIGENFINHSTVTRRNLSAISDSSSVLQSCQNTYCLVLTSFSVEPVHATELIWGMDEI